jgi:hypothetical protein
MSLDGRQSPAAMAAALRESSQAATPISHQPNAQKKFKRAFNLFQKNRKRGLLHSIIDPTEDRLKVCACGQPKKQSATYCLACADARYILRRKFDARESVSPKEPRVVRVFHDCTARKNNVSRSFYEDATLDRLVNLYENELSRYG